MSLLQLHYNNLENLHFGGKPRLAHGRSGTSSRRQAVALTTSAA